MQNSKAEGGKSKLAARDRDVTEQIALGLPQKTAGGGEAQFDQRLFNRSHGMDSGFGDDEAYNVYDRPWRESSSLGSNIYRPTRGTDSEAYGLEVEQMMAANRFVPDQRFSGADADAARRSGPVEFQSTTLGEEKDEDFFGVIRLLSEAKNAGKRPAALDERDKRDDRDKKRRRDRNYKE